jgi:hypothetical protein
MYEKERSQGLNVYKSNIFKALPLNGGRVFVKCLLTIKSMKLLKPFQTPPIMRLAKSTIHNRISPTVAVSRPHVSFIGPCLFNDAVRKSKDVAWSGRFVSE